MASGNQATSDIAAPPTSPFSIDDEHDDCEDALLAAADADELEGNYNSDDDDSSDDERGHDSTVKLTSRTNLLMKNFNDYLSDITGEDATAKRRSTPEPTIYRDFIDIEENIGDETPSYDDVERELQMQGRYDPKRKRAKLFRNSKRVKRAVGTIIIAATIIGVSVGVTSSKKNQRLPDWNQELEDQIEKEGITGDGLPGAKPYFGGQMGYPTNNAPTNSNAKPIPEFHNAASGNHHAGSGPYNQNAQGLNQPHLDNAHQIVDGVTHVSSGTTQQELSDVYMDAQAEYKPVWFDRRTWTGTSYKEAEDFCASRTPTMEICPYEAICPEGPIGHPNGGTKNDGLGSWAPVNNNFNTWVQVGETDPCLLYSYSNGYPPDWGLVPGANELQTRNIMCCEVDDTAQNSAVDRNPNLPNSAGSDQQQQQQQQQQKPPVEVVIITTSPTETTEAEAPKPEKPPAEVVIITTPPTETTEAEAPKLEKPPVEVVIITTPPTETTEAEAPKSEVQPELAFTTISIDTSKCEDHPTAIIDATNLHTCENWIAHVGRVNLHEARCGHETLLKNERGETLLIRDVCRLSCGECGVQQQPPQAESVSESEYYNTEQTNMKPDTVAEEYLAAEEWNPTWYSRSDGWSGTTYQEASDFCKSLGDTSDLCNYSVICPTGPNHLPYGGDVDEAGGSWAPIKDSFNGWVQVGSDNMCIRYMTLNLDSPLWGIEGGNEELTRHLPCCTPPFLPTYVPSKLEEETASVIATPPNTSPSESGEMSIYDLAAMQYKPMWHDSSTGWSGQTWEEANTFCASMKNNFNEQMALCPYDAVCPLGSKEMPFQGVKPDFPQMWVPTASAQGNEWVQVGSDLDTVCMTYREVVGREAEWGLNGGGNKELTRYVMCCAIHMLGGGDIAEIEHNTSDIVVADELQTSQVESKYNPVQYDRQNGWRGSSYDEAIIFCASQGSRIPCYYESYCPNGENADPFGGVSDTPNGAWAPIMDAPNSWVQVGKVGTCQKYNDIHSHPPLWGLTGENSEEFTSSLLCCDEPDEPEPTVVDPFFPLTNKEEAVLNDLRPLWFSRSDGYRGTTHEEAELFCNTVSGMQLCPIEAYCPNGPTTDNKPLYLQRGPFQGEQWAPVSPLDGAQTDLGNKYVMIGTLDGKPSSTCMPYDALNTNPLPPWSADGSQTELKEHILCCEKSETMDKHAMITKGMAPVWLDSKHGWGGGSHQDAQQFCSELGAKKLCPYAVYCPDGVGKQPLGGHGTDFNSQGVQYAPIYGDSNANAWVMIGQKDGNAATTCMLHTQLEGVEPDWGLTQERQEIKNHILCCSF